MADETTPGDSPEPLDLSALNVEDAGPTAEVFGVPNAAASRPRRRGLFSNPAGDKAEDTPRPVRRKPTIPKRKGQFVQPLTQMYAGLAMVLMPIDPVCANAIMQSASRCAESLDALAYQNDAVRRALHALTQTSAMGAVIIAHAPILMAVAMHHSPVIQNAMGEMGSKMAENIATQMAAQNPPDER